MLWRVRTTLSERPGSLATLAARCGDRKVNILGLQIFPGVGGVTDELVLRAPARWRLADVAALVEGAGGRQVAVAACTEHALVDGPTRYLHAARRLRVAPDSAEQVLAELLDAAPGAGDAGPLAAVQDTLDLPCGDGHVALRRTAVFTATEHARAAAFVGLAADLLEGRSTPSEAPVRAVAGDAAPLVRTATLDDAPSLVRMHARCSGESVYRRFAAPLPRLSERLAARLLAPPYGAQVAVVGTEVVGLATLTEPVGEDADARAAGATGAPSVLLRARADNPALLPLVFASGLRGRVRLSGDTVVVTAGLAALTPGPSRRGERTPA